MVQDKYYGFQELAELCAHVITSLFPITPHKQHGLDSPPPPPPLAEFIAYALCRTRLPTAVVHQALLLLSRLKARYPTAHGTCASPHRLFLSSLMLSSKISQDDTYSNKSWQVVSRGLFTLREVNQMERELFAFLGWNVVVQAEELTAWMRAVVEVYESDKALGTATTPLAVARQPTLTDRKRRRYSSSSSQSSSPDTCHRLALDAAAALLGVPKSTPKRRTPDCSQEFRSSTCSSQPSLIHYTSSSCFTSPIPGSGRSTPSTPSTPTSEGGPITPDHIDQSLAPVWSPTCGTFPTKERQSTQLGGSIAEVTTC